MACAAAECFVCTGTEGELLSDCCSCRDRHVHLACLQRLRACTPAHAHHCAVCLAPYRSGLGYFSLWASVAAAFYYALTIHGPPGVVSPAFQPISQTEGGWPGFSQPLAPAE